MGFSKIRPKTVDQPRQVKVETQKTLKSSICCTGVALHSGTKVTMTLNPSEPNTGIVFKRTDIGGQGAIIPARWDHVVDTRMCTAIGNEDGVSIGTIEHLMAAFAGCHIDNAEVEINGAEVPVMDGSSEPFVFLIECAGILDQGVPRRGIRILKPVTVEDGDAEATLYPAGGFSVGFEIDFDSSAIGRQEITLGLVNGTFKKELCRARTFGFLQDVERLWENGLARGGSFDNVIVVSGDKVMNSEGLRYDDEFVRHKALDAVGDLYNAGGPIIGRYHGRRAGHAVTNKLLRALFADPEAWCYDTVSIEDADAAVFPIADDAPISLAAAG